MICLGGGFWCLILSFWAPTSNRKHSTSVPKGSGQQPALSWEGKPFSLVQADVSACSSQAVTLSEAWPASYWGLSPPELASFWEPLRNQPTTSWVQATSAHSTSIINITTPQGETASLNTQPCRKAVMPGFFSPVFLVPKKGSRKMRMIYNMAISNRDYLERLLLFKMTRLVSLGATVQWEEFMSGIDLQGGCLNVPIHPLYRKYLRFFHGGWHYQWADLPFGISTALWLFTWVTRPITVYLHTQVLHFDVSLDDCLLHHLWDSDNQASSNWPKINYFNWAGWSTKRNQSWLWLML